MSKLITLSALSSLNANDLFYISTSLSADRKATANVLLSFITQGLSSLSANNASVYSTVNTNSATNWNYQGNDVKALTGNWQSTYTQFSAQSANNASVYSTVTGASAGWTQTLSFNSGNAQLSISNGNTVSLSSLSASGGSGGSLPVGGTANQILVKNSTTNNDASWKDKRITLTLPILSTTGSISCNALSADRFVVTLSGASTSATFATPISAYDAQMIMWNVRYASNVSRVSLASGFRTPLTTLNWSLSTNRMDIFASQYNQPDNKWDVISFAPGYQL
jgi:hypothetical protein